MSERIQYQVFLFAAAQTELGAAVESHLREGPEGTHLLCEEINASGPLFSMKLAPLPVDPATPANPDNGSSALADGHHAARQLMVPVAMVKLVVAVEDDSAFGFARRRRIPEADVP